MILGLYNESRGTDSCGYYFNGNIERGVGKDSKFSDFIAKEGLVPGTLPGVTFMGHTRKSTSGANTINNAHPHVVDNNYVQTHNGVIKEIWPLCKKYDVDSINLNVDSIGLAHLIHKVGPETILKEYRGYAALAFTRMEQPNTLYLFHGKSKESQHGAAVSERPLFILIQDEGIYYSSMKESLVAINDSAVHTPFLLLHNILWEIADGLCTGVKVDIDREDTNIGINIVTPTPPTPHKPAGPYNANNYQTGAGAFSPTQMALKPVPSTVIADPYEDEEEEEDNDSDLVLSETYPDLGEEDVTKVIYHKGRFHQVVKSPGGSFSMLPMHGDFVIDRNGIIADESLAKIQILHIKQSRYYFINGAMIKSKFDYDELVKDKINGMTASSFRMLARKSKYPLFHLKTAWSGGNNLWYHQGNKVWKTEFEPKFSNRKYRISRGITKQIRTV